MHAGMVLAGHAKSFCGIISITVSAGIVPCQSQMHASPKSVSVDGNMAHLATDVPGPHRTQYLPTHVSAPGV